jgi:outer membrane protein OmpA-like peptidoglycan-associated protein
MMRMAGVRAAAALFVLLTAPAVFAQARDNSWEIGTFAGENFYANELKLQNSPIFGVRIGFNITPALEVEVTVARSWDSDIQQPTSTLYEQPFPVTAFFDTSSQARLTSANLRAVGNVITDWRRWKPFVFVGAGRHEIELQDSLTTAPDGNTGGTTVNLGAGARFFINDHLAVRAEGSIEYAVTDIYWNQIVSVGIVAVLGGAKPSDRDGDGVTDVHDRCVDTPKGAVVDRFGCPLDGDKDGVFDGLDKCPDTPEKWPVGEDGCPTDSDGDGVPDGAEKCADTPEGARVDDVGCPLDGDGDGIFDGLDECDGTPFGARVDAKGCPLDEDKDGVPDGLDQCAKTPAGATIDAKGCPSDSDGDKIFDGLDECADTPPWWTLDEKGCPTPRLDRLSLVILERVTFKSGSSALEPDAYKSLDQAAEALSYWSDLRVEVGGYTDNRGSDERNRAISLDRAKTVKAYFVSKGIAAERLTVKGYGSENPVADNNTPEGQAQNRRVELKKSGGDESIHPPLSAHTPPPAALTPPEPPRPAPEPPAPEEKPPQEPPAEPPPAQPEPPADQPPPEAPPPPEDGGN